MPTGGPLALASPMPSSPPWAGPWVPLEVRVSLHLKASEFGESLADFRAAVVTCSAPERLWHITAASAAHERPQYGAFGASGAAGSIQDPTPMDADALRGEGAGKGKANDDAKKGKG